MAASVVPGELPGLRALSTATAPRPSAGWEWWTCNLGAPLASRHNGIPLKPYTTTDNIGTSASSVTDPRN